MNPWYKLIEKMPREWRYVLLDTNHFATAVEGYWDGHRFHVSREPSGPVSVNRWKELEVLR